VARFFYGPWYIMLLLSVVRCPHTEDFDWQNQSGQLARYYTYGAAVVQVEVDCLTGNYTVFSKGLSTLATIVAESATILQHGGVCGQICLISMLK